MDRPSSTRLKTSATLGGKVVSVIFRALPSAQPNSTPDPVYILLEDFTHVKFYRMSLQASVELDAGRVFAGFHHVEDWVPQRIVTATGPNALPR